jgi:anthranilate phosphoribosyltransferase
MDLRHILEDLARGRDLEGDAARSGFEALFSGELSPAQSGAMLLGLRAKGATATELAAAVQAALRHAHLVRAGDGPCIDTCGTGGDGRHSFNCSTAVAVFLADMGYSVVKHGNRAVSSSCGSADVVESLGLPFTMDEEEVVASLVRHNFAFLYAPSYHPAFAEVAPIRKELGIPTLFNLMGPLLNPARPTHQLLGVGSPEALQLMAQTLALNGVRRAAVVHGAGGFDELTPCGQNDVVLVRDGDCESVRLDPAELGIRPCRPEDLACRDKEQALELMSHVLRGRAPEAVRDMLALNLGMALSLLDGAELSESVRRAGHKVEAGLTKGAIHAA